MTPLIPASGDFVIANEERRVLARQWLSLVADKKYVEAATLASRNTHVFDAAVTIDTISAWAK